MNSIHTLFKGTSYWVIAILVLLLCSCSSDAEFNGVVCDNHFDILTVLDEQQEAIDERGWTGKKIIIVGEQIDTVYLNTPGFIENFNVLREFDIDQPNLIGRYNCTDSTDGEYLIQNFRATDDRLQVRHLYLRSKGDEHEEIGGVKYVGSPMASIEKSFTWNIPEKRVSLDIEYINLFGTHHNYQIQLIWPAESSKN